MMDDVEANDRFWKETGAVRPTTDFILNSLDDAIALAFITMNK
jgi:hypothetical protein